MACSKQHGVRTYLDFVEHFTGETITQTEWHRIRQLTADSEAGEQNTSAKLSRRRVTEREATAASMNIADSIYRDMGFDSVDSESASLLAVASNTMKERARSANVSYGTYASMNYLAENGVSKTLEKIRNEKKPNVNDKSGEQQKSDADREAFNEHLRDWTRKRYGGAETQEGDVSPSEYPDICDDCEDNVCSMEHDHSESACYCTACYNSYNSVATDEAEQSVGADAHSLEALYNYEVWKISSEDGPRSVAAFHELERRALPDLEELRSSYSQYPDNALEQPTLLMDKLAPAMREFERLEGDKETPKADLEKLASLVSDAAEDANYHTFNSWFMERSRKNGLDIESGGELRRKDELAEIAETESGSSKSGAVNHGVGWDQDYWNAVTR